MPKTKQAPENNQPIEDYASLVETLMVRQKSLPKRLNQIAQFFLNNPEDVAIYNIVGLSKLAGVPAANITRFAKELGFAGFADLQDVFRQRLVGPRMTYADRIKALGDARIGSGESELDLEQPRAIFDTFVQTAVDSLLRLREDVDDAALNAFVDAMAGCDAIHICAARGAFGIGAYCFYGLAKVGRPVHLIDNLGAMRAAQVRAIRQGDAVLLLTFDDYTAETIEVAEMAAERKIPILAITDNELSPVVGLADQVLYVKEAHLGHFRSQVPAFVLCQSLIVSLSKKKNNTLK